MRVLANLTPAILNRIKVYVKKQNKVVPIKLTDGRWGVPDSVLTIFPEYADEIIANTTYVPDYTVSIDQGTRPPFVPLPKPAPQPPPVRPPQGKPK